MVNLPLSKQKKDIHICKRFGVVVVIVATSLTHPTSVSMGMNMRLLEEINLVVVILNKTNNMENNMKKTKGKCIFLTEDNKSCKETPAYIVDVFQEPIDGKRTMPMIGFECCNEHYEDAQSNDVTTTVKRTSVLAKAEGGE